MKFQDTWDNNSQKILKHICREIVQNIGENKCKAAEFFYFLIKKKKKWGLYNDNPLKILCMIAESSFLQACHIIFSLFIAQNKAS